MATKQSTKTRPITKQQIAYEHIKSSIEAGKFAPRQRLVLDALARELSISQVPIREAVRRLEAQGLVEFSANSGAVVAGADPEVWFELMEVLALQEGYATASAAPRMTARDLKRLRSENEQMRAALARWDFAEWSDGNSRFHSVINAKCGNAALVDQMEAVRARVASISRFLFPHSEAAILHTLGPDSGRSALEAHEWLIDAFEREESVRIIERHAREHILLVASRTRDFLKAAATGGSTAGRKR
jgi:DNA-binding GntR family transcriptional regulator